VPAQFIELIGLLYKVEADAHRDALDAQALQQRRARRNWLFADTVGGANASANLYSLLQTCVADGIDGYRYLRALLLKLPKAKAVEDFENLLPGASTLPDPDQQLAAAASAWSIDRLRRLEVRVSGFRRRCTATTGVGWRDGQLGVARATRHKAKAVTGLRRSAGHQTSRWSGQPPTTRSTDQRPALRHSTQRSLCTSAGLVTTQTSSQSKTPTSRSAHIQF
jgi:hypothetical protein